MRNIACAGDRMSYSISCERRGARKEGVRMGTVFTKLADGSWGVRVQGPCDVGMRLTVRRKDGTESSVRVTAIVSSEGGVKTCRIESAGGKQAKTESTYRRKYGWDGKRGSASYYSSGMYDEES